MAAGDATLYSLENVGVTLTPARDATLYSLENLGVTLTPSKDATLGSLENVGVELPPYLIVEPPVPAWGIDLRGKVETTLWEQAADAASYSYLGDVTE